MIPSKPDARARHPAAGRDRSPVAGARGDPPFRILIESFVFHPVIGGIPTSSALIAAEIARSGHEVRILTPSTGDDCPEWNYKVVRAPDWIELCRQVRWCDVLVSMHLSVQLAWPLAFIRRPWVVAHHSWLTRLDGSVQPIDRVKRWIVRTASCISVSQAVADHVESPSVVIAPPYNDAVFRPEPTISRDRELLFVGRLVSSKGLDVLLNALAKLRQLGRTPRLTVVGDGPEMPRMRSLAGSLHLNGQVEFAGARCGGALRESYCSHRILVVPSITPETFGIVALEGIACGCAVVASDRAGGLAEAIGPCGVTFRLGDASSLAGELDRLLSHSAELEALQANGARHARNFTARSVAAQYLDVVRSAVAAFRGASCFAMVAALLPGWPV